ncbi:MAG TPA: DNA translocase FtsK [Anaerolineae bacterium]|nr:DNA translocase FtsK [Anaerolineae bacterium]
MRKKLEFQADRIEAVLTMHKVPARVTGGTVTPRWVRFQVLPAVGAKISKIKGLSEELAAALDAHSCRVSRRGAAVAVEVPRDDPQPVRLLPLFRQLDDDDGGVPPVTAVLGLAEDGAPLLIRLPSPDVAHILVAGTTGSGKTVLLQAMILSLAMVNRPRHLVLVLVDPKGHAFGPFEGLPHLARPVIRETGETIEALHSLVRLMERQGTGGGASLDGRPSVVVVIDELADLLMVGGKPVQVALTRLTQRGREAGIHVVAATQKPTTAVLGPLVKANFPVRLTGRVTSIEDARTATGWSGTGAERLMGRGDFLAVAEGRVIRFQTAYVSPAEIQELVRRIGGPEWRVESGEWRMENGRGEALSANPSVAPSRQVSLSWPARRLTEVLRGGV